MPVSEVVRFHVFSPGNVVVVSFPTGSQAHLTSNQHPHRCRVLAPLYIYSYRECFLGAVCPPGVTICDDPHMQGLRGQRIEWSGVDGSWYCLIKADASNFHVNVRLTAPLATEFPDRQLVTGIAILSEDHSLVVEVANPYSTASNGCPEGVTPCLADGGVRIIIDGQEDGQLLRGTRGVRLEGEYVNEPRAGLGPMVLTLC